MEIPPALPVLPHGGQESQDIVDAALHAKFMMRSVLERVGAASGVSTTFWRPYVLSVPTSAQRMNVAELMWEEGILRVRRDLIGIAIMEQNCDLDERNTAKFYRILH